MARPVLYDQYGNPIDLEALKREQAAPTTTGVRNLQQGHPSIGLTPQRLARVLREAEDGDAQRYLELAEEMEEKNLHYLAVLNTRKLQVTQLDITVVPADDSALAAKHADLVRQVLDGDALQLALVDIMDALGKGYSVTEIAWDTSEGDWQPVRFDYRLPTWFGFDLADGTTLRLRDEAGQLVAMKPYGFIQHRHQAKSGLPVRGGLARVAAWAYLFANYGLKDWVTFAEVYGHPLRVGKYPASATEAEKDVLLRAVANIGADAAAIIPASMLIEFVQRQGATGDGELYEKLLKHLEYSVSKAVLGQTTTTDAVAGGHAVSKEHNQVRGDIEKSDAKQLAATLKRDIARPLVDLNHGPQKAYPNIIIGRAGEEDLKQLTQSLQVLVPLGMQVSVDEVRGRFGFNKPKDGEAVLQPQPQKQAMVDQASADPAAAARRLQLAAAQQPAGNQTDLQRLSGLGIALAQGEIDQWVALLREALSTAASLDDALYRLLEVYPELPTDRLGEIMAEVMGSAGLVGAVEVLDEAGNV